MLDFVIIGSFLVTSHSTHFLWPSSDIHQLGKHNGVLQIAPMVLDGV